MLHKKVLFCGLRGTGKSTLVAAMTQVFPELKRIPTHTTRLARFGEVNGVHYLFVSPAEFDRMLKAGELIDKVEISPLQRSGPSKVEFLRHPLGVTDVIPRMVRSIRSFVEQEGGEVLMIGVRAPEMLRRERIRARQTGISDEEVDRLIREDPVTEAQVGLADVVIRNDEQGNPKPAIQKAAELVEKFLGRG